MNTQFPNTMQSQPAQAPKYGMKHALILLAILAGAAAILALAVVLIKQIAAPGASLPKSKSVDAERFETRYGSWGTIRDFRAKSPRRQNEPHFFSATLELPQDTDFQHLKWYVEIYQDGELLDVTGRHPSFIQPEKLKGSQRSAWEAAKRRGNDLFFLELESGSGNFGLAGKPYRYLSYVARAGQQCTAVPSTSIVTPNSSGSDKPVAYERNLNMKQPAIEISNGELIRSQYGNDGSDDQIKFKLDIVDEEFLMQFEQSHVHQRQTHDLFFVIENEYGSILRYQAVELTKNLTFGDGTMTLPAPRMAFNPWESNWFRRGPLKIYIIKRKRRTGSQRSEPLGIGESLQVHSNVMTVGEK